MQQIQLLTPDEFALRYRISIRKVQYALRNGILPSLLVGNQYRIDPTNTGDFVRQVGTASESAEALEA